MKNKYIKKWLCILCLCSLFFSFSRNIPAVMKDDDFEAQSISAEISTDEATVLQNPTVDSDGVVTWDSVYFGNY